MNRLRKIDILKTTVVPAVALLGVTACGVSDEDPASTGKRDTSISSVTFEEGANIREEGARRDNSADGSSNRLTTLSEVAVLPTESVLTRNDENGTWYGVDAKALAEQVEDPDQKKAILEDRDGTVWANDDRATPDFKDE